jgi:hypothetical protein
MRQIENLESPLVEGYILGLACLPYLGNASFNMVEGLKQKKVVLSQTSSDLRGMEAVGDKAQG